MDTVSTGLQRSRAVLAGQVALVTVVLFAMAWQHWSNDGLWYQGDSPRHAANGLFWVSYLTSFSPDPVAFALAYYARYPVIHPTSYPPLFYLLEGSLFALIAPSPYVAKALVLGFALVAALYTLAWLRDGIAPAAGWAAPLVLLQPEFLSASNAVLLNVPACALTVGTLYHARRWIDAETLAAERRQFRRAAVLAALALLTYFPSGVALLVVLAWVAMRRRWSLLATRHVAVAVVLVSLLLLPCLYIIVQWAPRVLRWLSPSKAELLGGTPWLYYAGYVTRLCSPPILVLALVGAVVGWRAERWSSDVRRMVAWVGITYVVFSWITVKEVRYVLPVTTALVFLGVVTVFWLASRVAARSRDGTTGAAAGVAIIVALVAVQAVLSWRVRVPVVHGFREAAAFFEEVAPAEPVLYDGFHDGNFGFYMLSRDPGMHRGVVLARKVLGSLAPPDGYPLPEDRPSPDRVLQLFNTRGGTRWVVVEDSRQSRASAASQLFRTIVPGPQFEFVRTLPVSVGALHVYRFLGTIERPDALEMPFPDLQPDRQLSIRPLPPSGRPSPQPEGRAPVR